MATQLTLPRQFADWYAQAAVDQEDLPSDKHRQAVLSFAQRVKVGNLPGLVRVAFQQPGDDEAKAALVEAIRKQDASFGQNGAEFLLAILAGGVCAALAAAPDSRAALAGNAVLSAEFLGWSAAGEDLPEIARSGLRAGAIRSRELLDQGEVVAAADAARDLSQSLRGEADGEGDASGDDSSDELASVADGLATALGGVGGTVAVLREELDILWWIFAGHSVSRDVPWREMPLSERVLTCAHELADRTDGTFGVPAAPGLLGRVITLDGTETDDVTVEACIDAVARDWRSETLARSDGSMASGLAPIHRAMADSLDVEDDSWANFVEKATGLRIRTQRDPVAVAMQWYRELLIVKTLAAP